MKKPRTGVTNKYMFIALAKRYLDITIKDIEEVESSITDLKTQLQLEPYGLIITKELTGFGSEDCTLCRSTLKRNCKECYWMASTNEGCAQHKTYLDIYSAQNKEELKEALAARSAYMSSVGVKHSLNKEE